MELEVLNYNVLCQIFCPTVANWGLPLAAIMDFWYRGPDIISPKMTTGEQYLCRGDHSGGITLRTNNLS